MYSKMVCNNTCCCFTNSDGVLTVYCFIDHDFPKNLTSLPAWELGVRWTFTILVTLVAVLGNMSIILLLIKNRLLLKTSVNLFILNMSVADLITSLAGPVPFTIRDTHELWVLGKIWCHLEGYIQMLVMLVSVMSLVVISCDRMIGVVYPLHQHLRNCHATLIIIAIWVLSAITSIPFAIYRNYAVHEWKNFTERICEEIPDKIHIWWIVVIIFLIWVPLLVMLTSFSVISFKLKKFAAIIQGQQHPAILHMKKRVVKMMFVVVIVFIICWTPLLIFQLIQEWISEDDDQVIHHKQLYSNLLTVSQYMIYVSVAVNPIIYGLFHKTFRRAFRVTFACCFKRTSAFVLTPRDGRRGFVWSVKSHNHRRSRYAARRNRRLKISVDPGGKKRVIDTEQSRSVSPSFKEDSVANLQAKKMALVSRGALGHLIDEVIEEETTSDIDSERML